MVIESSLLALLFILTLGLLIPEAFKRFRVPLLTFIIMAGAITGPNGLGYIKSDSTISFFGFLGMVFLMFMAGLETDVGNLAKNKNKIFVMALLNGLVPFLFGVLITRKFGYSWEASILVGIVFISSSVAIIVPSLKAMKGVGKRLLQLILSAVMLADITSLVALAIVFQEVEHVVALPFVVYVIVLLVSVYALFAYVPEMTKYMFETRFKRRDRNESRLRFVIIVLVAILAYFSVLGAHPILAAFLAGMALADVIAKDETSLLKAKLNTLGHGLFIPVFFFVVGMEMDISLFRHFDVTNLLMILLILGLIFSKFISGFIAGRWVGLSRKGAALFGTISITQLTTTLAVTYSASSVGIIDTSLTTSIIIVAMITTFVGPISASYVSRNM